MGGTIKKIVSNPVRLGADIMTFGTNELARKAMPGVGKMEDSLSAGIFGGKDYTPQLLSTEDPKMLLAQTGGAPLLTQIALGANVDDALAGYFGKASGADFKQYYDSLDSAGQSAIDAVKNQLTQIQQNTDLRNKAVQQVVNDFPNVVSMTAPKVIEAKQRAGEEFDQATKGYLDYAMKSIAAKAGGANTVSSGATIQAGADAAAKLGMDKLSYVTGEGNKQLDLLGQGWQQQYTEANALRNFQQKMLGQGASQGFSATQSMLERNQRANIANTGAVNQKNAADAAASNQLFGTIAGAGVTAGLTALAGPAAGAMGGSVMKGATDSGFSGPATPGYAENNDPSRYGINIGGGYR